jgi:hypothetical protein
MPRKLTAGRYANPADRVIEVFRAPETDPEMPRYYHLMWVDPRVDHLADGHYPMHRMRQIAWMGTSPPTIRYSEGNVFWGPDADQAPGWHTHPSSRQRLLDSAIRARVDPSGLSMLQETLRRIGMSGYLEMGPRAEEMTRRIAELIHQSGS